MSRPIRFVTSALTILLVPCRCCGEGTAVDNSGGVVPTCCEGSFCEPYLPSLCTCDPTQCLPEGAPCPIPELGPCCPGSVCVGMVCR